MQKSNRGFWSIGILAASLICLPVVCFESKAQVVLSPSARISVLTCTPGADLYSVFGHSAIRVEDVQQGVMLDEVYNYGTFEFDDDFLYRFIKGQLDYTLSRTDYWTFQQEYLYTGRGISEQELLLDSADRQRLYELLLENYRPENRTYRYDYFHDNCSSRIGEIIRRAAGGEVRYPYVSPHSYSFREAIDSYLTNMPWTDFGIDLALGIPCDRQLDSTQDMFLPDSLMNQIAHATYYYGLLAGSSAEIIPPEFVREPAGWWTPSRVLLLVLLLHVILVRVFGSAPITIADRVILFSTGLAGVVLVFLWFCTDHDAAAWNLNLLWANPLNLIVACLPWSRLARHGRRYFRTVLIMLFILVAGWVFFPQDLHEALLPLIAGLIWIHLRLYRGSDRRQVSSSVKTAN